MAGSDPISGAPSDPRVDRTGAPGSARMQPCPPPSAHADHSLAYTSSGGLIGDAGGPWSAHSTDRSISAAILRSNASSSCGGGSLSSAVTVLALADGSDIAIG